jgi:hypothetical protein
LSPSEQAKIKSMGIQYQGFKKRGQHAFTMKNIKMIQTIKERKQIDREKAKKKADKQSNIFLHSKTELPSPRDSKNTYLFDRCQFFFRKQVRRPSLAV